MDKCFCHLNGLAVKDAQARAELDTFAPRNYEATPETLKDIIKEANPGSVITLTPGTYSELNLRTAPFYPENLTIEGVDGATIAGIKITRPSRDSDSSTSHSANFRYPKGLTIKNLHFTGPFSLINGRIDDLTIIDCTFTNGTISIKPNFRATDYYNQQVFLRDNYTGTMNNLIIEGNTFDIDNEDDVSTYNAIEVYSVNNLFITENTINKALVGGIFVNSSHTAFTTGKIDISHNFISNTDGAGIELHSLKNAEVYVLDNKFSCVNSITDPETFTGEDLQSIILATNCRNTTFNWGDENTYEDCGSLSVEGGSITVENCVNDTTFTSTQDAEWNCRVYSNGEKECYGTVELFAYSDYLGGIYSFPEGLFASPPTVFYSLSYQPTNSTFYCDANSYHDGKYHFEFQLRTSEFEDIKEGTIYLNVLAKGY